MDFGDKLIRTVVICGSFGKNELLKLAQRDGASKDNWMTTSASVLVGPCECAILLGQDGAIIDVYDTPGEHVYDPVSEDGQIAQYRVYYLNKRSVSTQIVLDGERVDAEFNLSDRHFVLSSDRFKNVCIDISVANPLKAFETLILYSNGDYSVDAIEKMVRSSAVTLAMLMYAQTMGERNTARAAFSEKIEQERGFSVVSIVPELTNGVMADIVDCVESAATGDEFERNDLKNVAYKEAADDNPFGSLGSVTNPFATIDVTNPFATDETAASLHTSDAAGSDVRKSAYVPKCALNQNKYVRTVTNGKLICPGCGKVVAAAKFCGECGYKLMIN